MIKSRMRFIGNRLMKRKKRFTVFVYHPEKENDWEKDYGKVNKFEKKRKINLFGFSCRERNEMLMSDNLPKKFKNIILISTNQEKRKAVSLPIENDIISIFEDLNELFGKYEDQQIISVALPFSNNRIIIKTRLNHQLLLFLVQKRNIFRLPIEWLQEIGNSA
jgi:hypothetical protein